VGTLPEHTLFDDVAELLADLSNSQNRFVGQLRELRLNPEIGQIVQPGVASQKRAGTELPDVPTPTRSSGSDPDVGVDEAPGASPTGVVPMDPPATRSGVPTSAGRDNPDRLVGSSIPLTESRPRESGPRRPRTLSRDYDFFSDLEEELKLLAERDGRPPTTTAPGSN
jgi:hypothetical protein